jgi:hypothetical protein
MFHINFRFAREGRSFYHPWSGQIHDWPAWGNFWLLMAFNRATHATGDLNRGLVEFRPLILFDVRLPGGFFGARSDFAVSEEPHHIYIE